MASILIVEDDEEIIELIRVTIEPYHYKIRSCKDGTQALELLKKENFDLLILDVMIPGMDGYSILLELERSQKNSAIPCIVLTALKPAEKLFEKFKNVKYFITKPFSSEDLIEKVNSVLGF